MNQPAVTGQRLLPVGEPILSDQEGSFAWDVLARRHPALIEQVRRAHPYGPAQIRQLDALREEITAEVLTALPVTAHDHAAWRAWSVPDGGSGSYFGRSWFDIPFLWAESYFYRRLLEAVDYYGDGPWAGVDPFEPAKTAELALIDALAVPEDREELLLGSVWGNRADLGFRAGQSIGMSGVRSEGPADHASPARDGVLVDEAAQLWRMLEAEDPGKVVVVADNAGRELLADLLLIDHLLDTYTAEQVILHLKPAPYYVSDATPTDVSACLRTLTEAGPGTAAVARRLLGAAASGSLRFETDPFYCAPLPFHQVPKHLSRRYATARLVVLKGDLNYRRLVGDTNQPATTSFTEATRHFPAPAAALRTLKSDVVVGLDPAGVARLDSTGEPWRTNGRYAVIQVNR